MSSRATVAGLRAPPRRRYARKPLPRTADRHRPTTSSMPSPLRASASFSASAQRLRPEQARRARPPRRTILVGLEWLEAPTLRATLRARLESVLILAYIDPGTGSMVIQLLLASLLSI